MNWKISLTNTSTLSLKKNRADKPHVLMIGPGEGVGGGISTLIDTILPTLIKQVSVEYFPTVKSRQLKDSGKLTLRNIKITISQYLRFLVALYKYHPKIIHLHTSQGIAWLKDTFYIIVGKALNKRVILHMHGGNFDIIFYDYPPLLKRYTRHVLALADTIISVSEEWKNRFAGLVSTDKLVTLLNCIDCSKVQLKAANLPEDNTNIIFIGRVGKSKGIFELVDALYTLRKNNINYHAWIIGAEESKGDHKIIKGRLEQYQLTPICELLGSLEREEALFYLCNASIFVLPSYYEGLPMVVLEALATGLPVVATPVGGIPEVVHNKYNGYIVPVGNCRLLADRLAELASDRELCSAMGHRSRQIAETVLNVESYVKKLSVIYSDILNT